jgi:hypothetical protein
LSWIQVNICKIEGKVCPSFDTNKINNLIKNKTSDCNDREITVFTGLTVTAFEKFAAGDPFLTGTSFVKDTGMTSFTF